LLLDGAGAAQTGTIGPFTKREVLVQITGSAEVPPRPLIRVTVAQALGKGDKFEQVIQHGTEIGASAFIPLATSRTIGTVDERRSTAKVERWSYIAKGAAEQSGRGEIPPVHPSRDFGGIMPLFAEYALTLLLDACGEPLPRILRGRSNVEESSCLLLVGPEGGFTPEEVETARKAGAIIASIGPFILRTETAALAALSQLLFWAAGENGWRTR
jgi:16S rRNA (uracil1498-N3)-methyltransferase